MAQQIVYRDGKWYGTQCDVPIPDPFDPKEYSAANFVVVSVGESEQEAIKSLDWMLTWQHLYQER